VAEAQRALKQTANQQLTERVDALSARMRALQQQQQRIKLQKKQLKLQRARADVTAALQK